MDKPCRGRGRPKGALNKKTIEKVLQQLEEEKGKVVTEPIRFLPPSKHGRPKGALNKKTLDRLAHPELYVNEVKTSKKKKPYKPIVIKNSPGRPKGSKNKKTLEAIAKEREAEEAMKKALEEKEARANIVYSYGRPKGSLNKKTLEKIARGEIEDPRYIVKPHYSHPGRPKKKKLKKRRVTAEKITLSQKMERCYEYAADWCYKHSADLYKYNNDFFVFRYKNDETHRRYQVGYDPDDYPIIWVPFTSYTQIIEM